jgi:hypothetical protein
MGRIIYLYKNEFMKHLLNNLSEEEKNSIREQHTDRIKIDTSKFKSLMESKLGDVKLISEQLLADVKPFAKVILTPLEGAPIMFDVKTKKPQSWGCLFEGQTRDSKKFVKLEFMCGKDENTPLKHMILNYGVKIPSKGTSKLSKKGYDLLSKHCGCNSYVKTTDDNIPSNSDTNSFV